MREFQDERNKTLREAREEAKEIAKEQRELVEMHKDFPKDAILSSSERSEVNARLDFIRSMLANASPDQLAAKIKAAHHLGSKVEKFAVWRVADERFREYREKGQPGATFRFGQELEDLYVGLFEDEFVRRASGPEELAQEAEELDKFCFLRSKGATNIADTLRPEPEFIARQRYARGGQPVVPAGGEPPTGEVANG